MCKQWIAIISLLLSLGGTSQTKPKTASKSESAAAVAQEMAAEIKQLEADIRKLEAEMKTMTDPDDLANAKEELSMLRQQLDMLKKMGGMMNNATKGMQAAGLDPDAPDQLVPKKDPARIGSIPATPSAAAMPAYLQQVQAAVMGRLDASVKEEAEKFYRAAAADANTTVANAAVGLWMGKMPLQALYIMSKAAVADAANPNTLNNYASMLTMAGAEQLALPILNRLNQQYPKNSTVLNNLGQAWLGLGDLDKASRYLDSADRLYPGHSQANLAKSRISESKGNTQVAAEALEKSANTTYSNEKANKLKKLGKTFPAKNLKLPTNMPADPLGLERFVWPAFPQDIEQSVRLEKEWQAFKEQCAQEMEKLSNQFERLQEEANADMEKRMQSMAQYNPLQGGPVPALVPFFAGIAADKLRYLVEDKDGGIEFRREKMDQELARAMQVADSLEDVLEKGHQQVDEKYAPEIGEGKSNPLAAYCADYNAVSNKFLSQANTLLYRVQSDYLEELRRRLNTEIYHQQYMYWPTEFEVFKAKAKQDWLAALVSQRVAFHGKGPFCKASEEKQKGRTKLPEFDDVACRYNSTMNLGPFEINSNCSRLSYAVRLGQVNYTRKIDVEKDKLLAASLEVAAGVGAGMSKGPVSAEAKAELRGKVEWNEKEITNWTITAEAGVSVGTNLAHLNEKAAGKIPEGETNYIGKALGKADQSVEVVGAKAQIGMNSGPSLEGRGLLNGLKIGQ
jgi:Flp pilus assembly protein TadD/outer membrane murein-binding lipoprotein Lpp